MSIIQKCRPREILNCCYVDEDNIDEFLKMVEPHMKNSNAHIERNKNFYTVCYKNYKVYYYLNSWYVYNWACLRYVREKDFDKDFEIVDDETRVL